MSVRVLVTGANSTVAQSVIKALNGSSLEVELFGCDINPHSPGLYRVRRAFLVKPFTAPDYADQMLELLVRHRIDVLLPAVEGELFCVADHQADWQAASGATIVVNPRRVLDVAQDKYLTACYLRDHGCSAPASSIDLSPEGLASFVHAVGFPLVIKPRRGACSRHVYVVNTMDELKAKLQVVPGPVLQEYLGTPEEEFTCGVFVDAHGALKGVATLRRVIANGITGVAEVGDFPDVAAEVGRIVAALRPVGACNVQLRRNRQGRPTAFEINPRFSSSVAIRSHFGFNEAEAAIRSFHLGEAIAPMHCRPGVAMRYVNEVYAEAHAVRDLIATGQMRPNAHVEANF
jgi:carbamoyl-phosphate synthase large subunit